MHNWIETTFNVSSSIAQVISIIVGLIVVLIIFGLFVFILRRLMNAHSMQNRNRQPRLTVMDSASIDPKRRLILVRRDNVEHLLLIGGPSDVVVEQNIVKNAPIAPMRQNTATSAGTNLQNIRTPKAPGPEIPNQPDQDTTEQQQSPAAQARSVVAPREIPERIVKRTAQTEIQPTTPSSQTGSSPSSQALGKDTAAAARIMASRPSASLGTPKGEQDPIGRKAQERGNANTKAPAVSADIRPTGQTHAPIEKRTTPSLSNLAKSFKARELKSYDGKKITPPSSGPAAKAKTAMLNQAEPTTVEEPKKVAKSEEEIAAKTKDASEERVTATSDLATAPESPAPELSSVQVDEVKPSSATDNDGENQSEKLTENDTVYEVETNDTSSAKSETAEEAPSDDNADEGKQHSDEIEAHSLKENEQKQNETQPTSEQADASKEVQEKPNLQNKNPLEDEMAKILDELVGQPNK